ncbi:tetratricopeptide repeat protein [Loktanella sp. R86503]|uniref:tetratricopeptide repeat protein n=1 Tax=Loktanella sp. R86503 TaxID=3093847 RepID=UPI0036D981F7
MPLPIRHLSRPYPAATRRPRLLWAALMMTGVVTLAGCKTSQERADDYYHSAQTLLEAGDQERAMLEFRNVFENNGFHKEARLAYADLLQTRGDITESYAQYLRVVEQYPDALEARLPLAQIAIDRGDWNEARRHTGAALTAAPADPAAQSLDLVLQYQQAVTDDNADAIEDAASDARARLARAPADLPGRARLVRIDLDERMRLNDLAGALVAVDAALIPEPEALDLHLIRAQLLVQTGDLPAIGPQLERMSQLFPDNTDVRQNLLRWYVSQNDTDGAAAYLRRLAGPVTNTDVGAHLTVVSFLRGARGVDAARAELVALQKANADTPQGRLYAGTLAALEFETGTPEDGIAQMRAVLAQDAGSAPSDDTRKLQIMLAQMLSQSNDRAGAQDITDAVLAQDPGHVEALKLQAGWLIADDRIGAAIVALRTALAQNPQDSGTLTLMAQAHERDGDLDLAGERLALAVQVSHSAPDETLRYVAFLTQRAQTAAAITMLEDARRRAPAHIGVLTTLADLYLQGRDWTLAQRVVDDLRRINDPAARSAAPVVQAAILQGQNRTADSLSLLESQIDPAGPITDRNNIRAVAQILQTRIRTGELEGARSYLAGLLEQAPDDADLLMLDASLSSLAGDFAGAQDEYNALALRFPDSTLPVRYLVGVLLAQGDAAQAAAVIEAALPQVDQPAPLLMIKASLLEQDGQIDAAIAVHEKVYAADSSDIIVANNLASLLASYRDDDASLARAATIARRLRGTTVPAFADTYGWIAYRRGDVAEALPYLQRAAKGLPDDAMVQFHLGMALAAQMQINPALADQARDALTLAVDLGAGSPLPQFAQAAQILQDLPHQAAPAL